MRCLPGPLKPWPCEAQPQGPSPAPRSRSMSFNTSSLLLLACISCEEAEPLDCSHAADPMCFGEVAVDLQGPAPIFSVEGIVVPTRMEISHVEECASAPSDDGLVLATTPVWRVAGLGDA